MVLTTRQFSSQQYDASSIQGQGPIVLARAAACQIVGLLVQLGELSQFALDIYQALGYETHQAATRIDAVAARTSNIEAKLSISSQEIESSAPSRFFHNEQTMQWKREDSMTNDLFSQASRSIPLSKLVSATFAPPTIGLLNEFSGKDCTLLYSDPGFFFKQWALEEAKKFEQQREERKKMRQSRPKREKKTTQKVEVEGIEVKVFNKDGKEFGGPLSATASARQLVGVANVAAPRPIQVQTQPAPSTPSAKPSATMAMAQSPHRNMHNSFESTPSFQFNSSQSNLMPQQENFATNHHPAVPPTPIHQHNQGSHPTPPQTYDDYYPEPSFSLHQSYNNNSFEQAQDSSLDAILAAKQQVNPAQHMAPPPPRVVAPPPAAYAPPVAPVYEQQPPPPQQNYHQYQEQHHQPEPEPEQHQYQHHQQQYEAPESNYHQPQPPPPQPMMHQPAPPLQIPSPTAAPPPAHTPSPAAAALMAAGRPQLRSAAAAAENDPPPQHNALLGALRGGIQLRKADNDAKPAPAIGGGGLLADIKNRPMLRKASVVATSAFQQKPPPQAAGPSGLSAVMDIIARRKAIADSESESDDDDDWD